MEQNCKVFYRPISASIYWSGLQEQEQKIMYAIKDITNNAQIFEEKRLKKWPSVEYNMSRIFDALFHKELPAGEMGITSSNVDLCNPFLTVRHIDLKQWLNKYYPYEKPEFLYSKEELYNPLIDKETLLFMFVEKQALELRCQHLQNIINKKNKEQGVMTQKALTGKGEIYYLHLIGAMLSLMLSHSPSGRPYSCFQTQDAIISALLAHFPNHRGLSERTIKGKFAEARKVISDN